MSDDVGVLEWARSLGFPAAVAWYVLRYVHAELVRVRELLVVLVDRENRRAKREEKADVEVVEEELATSGGRGVRRAAGRDR